MLVYDTMAMVLTIGKTFKARRASRARRTSTIHNIDISSLMFRDGWCIPWLEFRNANQLIPLQGLCILRMHVPFLTSCIFLMVYDFSAMSLVNLLNILAFYVREHARTRHALADFRSKCRSHRCAGLLTLCYMDRF